VATERPVVTVFLDLETSGTDVTKDRIVELAATHVPGDLNAMGSSFSTTVCVPRAILEESQDAALVHGIADDEIVQGPSFATAWMRFLHWVDALLNYAIVEEGASDSDVEDGSLPQIHDHPVLLLAGHNSIGFDFPFLLCETIRHSLSTAPFEDWLYVDTLHISKCLLPHGCNKLQCISLRAHIDTGRAHRALDDCLALRRVVESMAQSLDVPLAALLKHFAVKVDLASSLAQLSVLMDQI